ECDGEKLVVHGHHRVMIYKDLGRQTVPCRSGCPGNQDIAKWTIKKRIAQGNKGFEGFPKVADIESRSELNEKEYQEYIGGIIWGEA
ncbi:unnamed protein product, partial [marine sediment metagenome]